MRGRALLGEGAHLRATQVVLGVQIEEVEEVQVDLGTVVRGIGLSAELYVALFVSIENVGSCTEGGEDLAEFVVLVGLVETSGDLVHRWHGASGGHVDPQGGKESEDARLKVFGVHHDIHFVLGVARVDSISESTVVIVPFHHEGTASIVLSMLEGRPGLGGPAVRVEVALGRAIEGRVFRVLSTMVVLNVFQTLTEVLVVVGLTPVGLVDNMGEKRGEFALANLSLSQAKTGVTFGAELGVEASSHNECLVSVEFVVNGEEMLEIFLTEDLHDHAHILFILVLHAWTTLKSGRVNASLRLGVLSVGNAILDTDTLVLIEPVVARPDTIVERICQRSKESRCECSLHLNIPIKIL
mmetsp:Transcript_12380/g.15790  ORF Transcript_12380/g.15790 Transcript_12380/m.15790 type:complete len:355 (-) Transcript_12380:4-1068(-)